MAEIDEGGPTQRLRGGLTHDDRHPGGGSGGGPGSALLRLALPIIAGVAGALYSSIVRSHPWEAALAVGLAIGTLTFAGIRARERIGRIHRQAQSPWERGDSE